MALATLGFTILGAVLNAGTFTGGNYLTKYFSGDDSAEERKRHDLATEKYTKDYNDWEEEQGKRELWMEEQAEKKEAADSKFRSTDEAFRIYAKFHPKDSNLKEPNFHDYYSPSKNQKNGELLFTVLSVAGLNYGIYKFV